MENNKPKIDRNKILEGSGGFKLVNENLTFLVFLGISIIAITVAEINDQSRQRNNLDITVQNSAEQILDQSQDSKITTAGKKIASKILNPWTSKEYVRYGVNKDGLGVLVVQTKDLDPSVIDEELMKVILGEGGQDTSLNVLRLKKLIQDLVGGDITIDTYKISPYHQLVVFLYH